MLEMSAGSNDEHRAPYVALRAIFSAAQQAACHHRELGWRLAATYTDPGRHVMTAYVNESYRMHIQMDSYADRDLHEVRMRAWENADGFAAHQA